MKEGAEETEAAEGEVAFEGDAEAKRVGTEEGDKAAEVDEEEADMEEQGHRR